MISAVLELRGSATTGDTAWVDVCTDASWEGLAMTERELTRQKLDELFDLQTQVSD